MRLVDKDKLIGEMESLLSNLLGDLTIDDEVSVDDSVERVIELVDDFDEVDYVPVNLNHGIKYRLTEAGENVLRQDYLNLKEFIERSGGEWDIPFTIIKDENLYCDDQLWSYMEKFGGDRIGMAKPILTDLNVWVQVNKRNGED